MINKSNATREIYTYEYYTLTAADNNQNNFFFVQKGTLLDSVLPATTPSPGIGAPSSLIFYYNSSKNLNWIAKRDSVEASQMVIYDGLVNTAIHSVSVFKINANPDINYYKVLVPNDSPQGFPPLVPVGVLDSNGYAFDKYENNTIFSVPPQYTLGNSTKHVKYIYAALNGNHQVTVQGSVKYNGVKVNSMIMPFGSSVTLVPLMACTGYGNNGFWFVSSVIGIIEFF
jgi:hypothetical protein